LSVTLTPSAEADVARAYQWYEGQRGGLGLEFVQRVDEAVARIERNPLAHAKLIDEARRVNLRQFPYGLWYKVEADGEIVVACLHHKRDSRLARERVKGVIEMPRRGPEPQ
jgi:toxin ParE1/3/4